MEIPFIINRLNHLIIIATTFQVELMSVAKYLLSRKMEISEKSNSMTATNVPSFHWENQTI